MYGTYPPLGEYDVESPFGGEGPQTAAGPRGRLKGMKGAPLGARKNFTRRVYFNLFVQLLVTVLIAVLLMAQGQSSRSWIRSHEIVLWIAVAATFGTACAMICCTQSLRQPAVSVFFLIIFTLCEGIMLGFCGTMFAFNTIMFAAVTTLAVFLLFTIYAFQGGDFTGYLPYLFGVLSVIGIFILAAFVMFASGSDIEWLVMLYDFIGVMVFTIFIVFDTQLILGEHGGHAVGFSVEDHLFASLNLYMDVINCPVNIFSFLWRPEEEREKL